MTLLHTAKLTSVILVFFGFLFIGGQFVDPDLWWHFKVGEEVMHTQEVPHMDTFSWTMPGHEWVDHEWALDALLWEFTHRGWWAAVLTFFAAVVLLPFWYWIRRARNFAEVWLVLLGALTMYSFVGVRPQMLSFAVFFVVYELLRRGRYTLLPFIFFAWANLHAGFASGLLLFRDYFRK